MKVAAGPDLAQQSKQPPAGTESDPALLPRPRRPGDLEFEAAGGRPSCTVRFVLNFHASYGQRLLVIGGHPSLGNWDVRKALELRWSEGDLWRGEAVLPAGIIYEYKYLVMEGNGAVRQWQQASASSRVTSPPLALVRPPPLRYRPQGSNSVLAVKSGDREVEVLDNFFGNPGAAVVGADGASTTRETRLAEWVQETEALATKQKAELRQAKMELALQSQEASRLAAELQALKRALESEREAREAAESRAAQLELASTARQTEVERGQLAALERQVSSSVRLAPAAANSLDSPSAGHGSSSTRSRQHPALRPRARRAAGSRTALGPSPRGHRARGRSSSILPTRTHEILRLSLSCNMDPTYTLEIALLKLELWDWRAAGGPESAVIVGAYRKSFASSS